MRLLKLFRKCKKKNSEDYEDIFYDSYNKFVTKSNSKLTKKLIKKKIIKN